jgi:hypothetical protein
MHGISGNGIWGQLLWQRISVAFTGLQVLQNEYE